MALLVCGPSQAQQPARTAQAQPQTQAQTQPQTQTQSQAPLQTPLLADADKAFEEGKLPRAGELYEKALKQGRLTPAEVLLVYVRLGCVYASRNQDARARAAFRIAGMLDPDFAFPPRGGRNAATIYKEMRAQNQHSRGKLTLTVSVPSESAADTAMVVVAGVQEVFVGELANLQITVQDPSVSASAIQPWFDIRLVEPEVTFEVPASVMTAGSSLIVRVDGLDGHGNRFVSVQSRVRVPDPNAVAVVVDEHRATDDGKDKVKKSGGFWSSPWPWVIGGAIIVGAGATFFATRSSDEAHVGAPVWITN